MGRHLAPSSIGVLSAVVLVIGGILPPTSVAVVNIEGTATQAIDPAWTNVSLARFDVLLIGGLVLWASRQHIRSTVRSVAYVLAGLGGGWICFDVLQHSVHTPVAKVLYEPALGWYLLATGSTLLIVIGAIGLAQTVDLPWVTVLGSIGILVGSYLPWLRRDLTVEPALYPSIIPPNGMNAGIRGFDFLLLGGVVLVLASGRFSSRRWIPAVGSIVVGAATVSLCWWYLPESEVFREAGYILAPGWKITAGSGVALVFGGGWYVLDSVVDARDSIRKRLSQPSGS